MASQKCSDYSNERFRSSQAYMGEKAVGLQTSGSLILGLETVGGGGGLGTTTIIVVDR